MWKDPDEHEIVFRLLDDNEWLNGAYDEEGNRAICDICGEEMMWDPIDCVWYCPECGQVMDRATYFNHIGAEPPGRDCMTNCCENYPLCKQYCERYEINPNDPMLT